MKKWFLSFLLVVAGTMTIHAQSTFQGQITYDWKLFGEGVEQIEAFMPTSSDYFVKGTDVLFRMNGGMLGTMMGDILVLGKKNKTYMVKAAESTAYEVEAKTEEEPTEKPTVSKEDETIEIVGYKCQKYKVVAMQSGIEVTQYVWATDQMTFPASASGSQMVGNSMSIEGVKGMPLKIMTSQNGITIVMTASKIDNAAQSKSLFKLPKNYKIEKFDPNSMGGFGM